MTSYEPIRCELEYNGPPPPAGQWVWVARWACTRTGATREHAIEAVKDAAELHHVARVPKWEHDEVVSELRAALAAEKAARERAERERNILITERAVSVMRDDDADRAVRWVIDEVVNGAKRGTREVMWKYEACLSAARAITAQPPARDPDEVVADLDLPEGLRATDDTPAREER